MNVQHSNRKTALHRSIYHRTLLSRIEVKGHEWHEEALKLLLQHLVILVN